MAKHRQTINSRVEGSVLAPWKELSGWLLLLAAIGGMILLLPAFTLNAVGPHFLVAVGVIGLWRYALRGVHFVRAMWFLYVAYPRLRERAEKAGAASDPSHAYFMVTSFRIDAETTARVYKAIIEQAIDCGYESTIVASIVEYGDELLLKALWENYQPPERVRLKIVRIAGTGKRDGLAFGFRAIARDCPNQTALVAVIDGDSVLMPNVMRKCAQVFHQLPDVGALTTNEFCTVLGSPLMDEWHKLRFAERHLNMCSMALSRRVLTLTGRMSVFRAQIVTQPSFIADVENDSILHWRLGRVKFLTGDDKSSWFSVVRHGWRTFYLPDAAIQTIEHPPDPSLLRSSRTLMFRWYGNSLRQNGRARELGPWRLGWFTYYVLQDQRVQMWTGLLGLSAAILASIQFNFNYLILFFVWIGITRCLMCVMLMAAGHRVGPWYPPLMYYNQIMGSLIKIVVFFFPDRQSWTRQKTTLTKHLDPFHSRFNSLSSKIMLFSACSVFAAVVLTIVTFKSTFG
ncbi:glycosyltransferase family 2 protein [Nevskia ramosa]|uniref:glycosyltransferase family 2 protein n=1 Tax=Nevskia ramosa TaxID=64002 RepID=UPI0003B5923D|nr:glycosyltransferase family 2 protein [Nevskia ramosa]